MVIFKSQLNSLNSFASDSEVFLSKFVIPSTTDERVTKKRQNSDTTRDMDIVTVFYNTINVHKVNWWSFI